MTQLERFNKMANAISDVHGNYAGRLEGIKIQVRGGLVWSYDTDEPENGEYTEVYDVFELTFKEGTIRNVRKVAGMLTKYELMALFEYAWNNR